MSALLSSVKLRLLAISGFVIALDQWTKHLVETELATGPAKVLIPDFLELIYVRNSGIAFGLFASGSNQVSVAILSLLGLLALTLVLAYFWKTPDDNRWVLTALALIVGGAVGNLADRITSGSVTDFIEVYVGAYHWPTFNVADSAISIGIVMIAIDALWFQRREVETAS